MAVLLAAGATGLVFGLGLILSGMVDPAKVLGFLDVAGDWDPSLALVMAAAVPLAALGQWLGQRRGKPAWAPGFQPPAAQLLDRPLLLGAALFGLGWGLAGFCPGPALASLALGLWQVWLFVAAMLLGMAGFELWSRRGR